MKNRKTDLQRYYDDRDADRLSIFVAVQVIAGSIFYLLFFVWLR